MKDKLGNNLPDFLIVGAAKCGTTSMYYYLDKFDDVFMSKPKEPKFITSLFLDSKFKGKGDMDIAKGFVTSYDEYVKMFENVKENRILGEASPDTLYYYKKAIPKIKETMGNPKIIIFLRNPVDRAFSAYMHMRRDLREELSFKDAIEKEDFRIQENYVFLWHYLKVGNYYEQVKAFKEEFSNVKVFLFDDLRQNSKNLIEEVRFFLGLKKIKFNFDNEKFNQSGEPKYPLLKEIFIKDNYFKRIIKRVLPNNIKGAVKGKVMQLEKVSLSDEDRSFLKRYYKEDILKLQSLIDRDLSAWLK